MFFVCLASVTVALFCILIFLNITKVEIFSPRTFSITSKLKMVKASDWLDASGTGISVSQFLFYSFFIFTTTFILAYTVSKTLLISLILGCSFTLIPYMVVSKKRTAKMNELMRAWPDLLRDISAHISSGNSLSKAMTEISKDSTSEIHQYIKRFPSLERTLGFKAALTAIRQEMNDPVSDRVIEVLVVANERGGKIVKEIIDDLTTSIMQDIAVAETIQSESVEMKINSRAVVVIPWCVLFMLTLSEGSFRDFYQSKSGTLIIGVGALMSALGVFILSRLGRVETEPRVFINREKTGS